VNRQVPGAFLGSAYLSLATFRKDGRPVATPVWFAVDGDRILVWSGASEGRVNRIHRLLNRKYWYVKPPYEAVLGLLRVFRRRESGGAAYIEIRFSSVRDLSFRQPVSRTASASAWIPSSS
jgi:hypothetical protein